MLDRGGPNKDVWVLVGAGDVSVDGLGQSTEVVETAAANAFLSEMGEPSFDEIQPGTGSGSEVQVKAGVPLQPRLHPRMLVGAVIVDDNVQLQPRRGLLIDGFQKADEFLMTMAGHTVADHFAVQNIEGGEQGGGAVALCSRG